MINNVHMHVLLSENTFSLQLQIHRDPANAVVLARREFCSGASCVLGYPGAVEAVPILLFQSK